MADIMLMRRGSGLVPVNQSDVEALNKLPIGRELKGAITQMRNPAFHRKAFALMNLGFQHWCPETTVTKVERDTVIAMGRFMVAGGLPVETAKTICSQFMDKLNAQREHIEADKSFEAFRAWLTVESGYYRLVQTPVGVKKEPVSISFSSMDEAAFGDFYRAIFGTLWRVVLSKSFPTEQAAENAVAELMSFD